MRRVLTPAEAALWRRVALSAAPLAGKTPPTAAPPAAEIGDGAAAPEPRAQDIAAPLAMQSPLRRRPSAAAGDRGGEKRVRRGALDIAARLDLHGRTQDHARADLLVFVQTARAQGARVVLVVTGRGGAEGGVLRRRLPDWLATAEFRPHLAGFAQAHRRHGGEGAFYVFLKRR